MVTAVRIHAHGGPEVLVVEDLPLADPGPGEGLVRNQAGGPKFFGTNQSTRLLTVQPATPLGCAWGGRVSWGGVMRLQRRRFPDDDR